MRVYALLPLESKIVETSAKNATTIKPYAVVFGPFISTITVAAMNEPIVMIASKATNNPLPDNCSISPNDVYDEGINKHNGSISSQLTGRIPNMADSSQVTRSAEAIITRSPNRV